jgi:hypothetical protein
VLFRSLGLQIGGTPQKEFPPIPAGLPPLVFGGADPKLTLGEVTATAGTQVVVPLAIDTAEGLESVQLTVRYDAVSLKLLEVQKTALSAGFVYTVVQNKPGELVIDASRETPLAQGSGALFDLKFAVEPTAHGDVALDFVSVRLNDTWLTVNPLPVAGADPTDGVIHVLAAPLAQARAAANATGNRKIPTLAAVTQPAPAPAVALKQVATSFDLGQPGNNAWLNNWVAPPQEKSKANAWTISAKPAGPTDTIH